MMNYLGTKPIVGSIIFDTVSCTLQVWDGTSWQIMANAPNLDESTDVIVKVFPDHCKILENSDLYYKILDTLSWMVISSIDRNPNLDLLILDHSRSDATAFINAAEILLQAELLTNIKVTKVSAFINPDNFLSFKREVQLCVAVKLDQSYIDHYDDIVAQQLVNAAIDNVQNTQDVLE